MDDSLRFMWLQDCFTYILAATGVIEIATGLMFYWSEAGSHNSNKFQSSRVYCSQILTIILLVDAFVLHCPWSEIESGYAKEYSHLAYDLGLIGGLYMLAGFR